MMRGLHRTGKLISPGLYTLAVRYARNRHAVMRFLSNALQTLVHHDCHPGNLFWRQSQPGLFDWQLVRSGEGIGDVAYFLATALDPEIQRTHETQLLSVYIQRLRNNGITGIDRAELLQRYRAHLIYPFEAMIVSLAVGGMIKLESNHELIRRTVAAVEDLAVFSDIPI